MPRMQVVRLDVLIHLTLHTDGMVLHHDRDHTWSLWLSTTQHQAVVAQSEMYCQHPCCQYTHSGYCPTWCLGHVVSDITWVEQVCSSTCDVCSPLPSHTWCGWQCEHIHSPLHGTVGSWYELPRLPCVRVDTVLYQSMALNPLVG